MNILKLKEILPQPKICKNKLVQLDAYLHSHFYGTMATHKLTDRLFVQICLYLTLKKSTKNSITLIYSIKERTKQKQNFEKI